MDFVVPIVLILGGILAASTVIIAKRPDAQQAINKLVPFQGAIGIALLVFGVIWLLRSINIIKAMSGYPIFGATTLTVVGASILLGVLFGMPLIVRLIPGDSPAEQKAAQFAANIAGFQVLIGLAGIVAGILALLFQVGLPMM